MVGPRFPVEVPRDQRVVPGDIEGHSRQDLYQTHRGKRGPRSDEKGIVPQPHVPTGSVRYEEE